ncbi:MAG: DUF177 domain-containing protein [Solirubrobacterales bacterium]
MKRLPSTTLDLAGLQLSPGEGARVGVPVCPGPLTLGGQRYETSPETVEAELEVSRTRGGHAMRLRFSLEVRGPCMRCLGPASLPVEIEAREVDQPPDPEMSSPYAEDGELDVGRWAHDALALALPGQALCRPNCAGLCPVCGESLNDADPADHDHGRELDPRWAKLRELDLE